MLKKLLQLSVAITMLAIMNTSFAFEVSGESFPADFEMTSWSSTSDSSSMTAEGVVGEGYGKVYLSYEFKSNSTKVILVAALDLSTMMVLWWPRRCKASGSATAK